VIRTDSVRSHAALARLALCALLCAPPIVARAQAPEAATDAPLAPTPRVARDGTRQRETPRPAEVAHWQDGRVVGRLTGEEAEARGLTIVDLRDEHVPSLFASDPSLGERGAQPSAETLRALAAGRFGAGEEFDRARGERFLSLYGVPPTLGALSPRLADEPRHRCHDAVDDETLRDVSRVMSPWGDMARRRTRAAQYLALVTHRARLAARGAAAPSAWAERRFRALHAEIAPVRAVQAHLRCEALLSPRSAEGVYDGWTSAGVAAYQRLHMVPSRSGLLDAATRAVLLDDSRERELRALLRTLRERVVDATGLIEDGSAAGAWGTVLGRTLDVADFRAFSDEPPLPDAAPDAISPATDAAARALGWRDVASVRAFFAANGTGAGLVAVRLPPPPTYHSHHTTLRAELDRGDVWYDFPFDRSGKRLPQRVTRRPRLVLYAVDGAREIALVRWPTTIGGWEPEQRPNGRVGMLYKNSDVGPRVWRDLVASPAWLPPPSTPDEDLVRRDALRGWRIHRDAFGPGYASAYGLVMLVHHVVLPAREQGAPPRLVDRGIRTHGSASYPSILRGTSHGCHRLFNHLALRLAGFLLAHRDHVRRGPEPVRYERRFRAHGRAFTLRIDSRGVRSELVPPVPVRVLEGTVRGRVKVPPERLRPLPRVLAARARAAAREAD
jgi:hypothetical protein